MESTKQGLASAEGHDRKQHTSNTNTTNTQISTLLDVTNGAETTCGAPKRLSGLQSASLISRMKVTKTSSLDKENAQDSTSNVEKPSTDLPKTGGIKKKRASFFTRQLSSFDGLERFQSAIASAASVFSSSVGSNTAPPSNHNDPSAIPSSGSSDVAPRLANDEALGHADPQTSSCGVPSIHNSTCSRKTTTKDNEVVSNGVDALLFPSIGAETKISTKSRKHRKNSKKRSNFLRRSGSHSPSIKRSPTRTVTECGSSCVNLSVSDRSGPSSGDTTPSPRSFCRTVESVNYIRREEHAEPNTNCSLQINSARQTPNTLTVPSSSSAYGAIPRTTTASNQPSSNQSLAADDEQPPKRCFCGHYSEKPDKSSRKSGRCKFCRTKPKYLPNQRSLDAGRIFGHRRERTEPRRALSEDRRGQETGSDPQYSHLVSSDQSPSTCTSHSSLGQPSHRRSIFSSRTPSVPFLRRQARLPDRHDHSFDQSSVTISPPILSTNLSTDYIALQSTSRNPRLPGINGSYSLDNPVTDITITPPRDHGLLTPPGPPPVLMSSSAQFFPTNTGIQNTPPYLQQDHHLSRGFRHNEPPASLPIRPYLQRPASLDRDNNVDISRHSHIPELQFNSASFEEDPTHQNEVPTTMSAVQQTLPCSTMHHILEEESTAGNEQQRMSHEMVEYLVPPSRYSALSRAHTDPSSSSYPPRRTTPVSPPPAYGLPAYEEVVKEPRIAPPSYEEALSSRTVSLRLNPRSLSYEERGTGGAYPSPPPPFRPCRSTYGVGNGTNTSCDTPSSSNTYEGCHASLTFTHSCPSTTHGSMLSDSGTMAATRHAARQLTRSSRAEEIPDIYWEQAARELDFCTCRKCQARYRQYFEEEPDPNMDAGMIPIETQVLMQEVLTDGMAFCSLM